MQSTMTSKGQVTVPKAVREFLGLKPGSRVAFRRTQSGQVELVPADRERPPTRFETLRGHARTDLTTDEILALTREAE